MSGTQEDDHRERRLLRRQINTVHTVQKCQPTVKKARVCKNCGNWIVLRQTYYLSQEMGKQWIHFRRRGMSQRRFLWTIERCYPEPRPVPQGHRRSTGEKILSGRGSPQRGDVTPGRPRPPRP